MESVDQEKVEQACGYPLRMDKSKMYILVKEGLPVAQTALACAHASLSGYLTFVEAELSGWGFDREKNQACGVRTGTELWAEKSFRKVVCSVTQEQFDEAKTYGIVGEDFRIMTESSLDNAEVAIVFRPRVDWEPFFRSLPLLGKTTDQVRADFEKCNELVNRLDALCPCEPMAFCGTVSERLSRHVDRIVGSRQA